MNITEFKDLDNDWVAERKLRLRYHRNQEIKDALREGRVEIAIMFAIVIGFFTFLYFLNKYQPMRERAAYIEGYYGVDHETALAMAESETTNH